MIINSSLKAAIISAFNRKNLDLTKYELIATEIIFYKYLISYISANNDESNDINSLVESYSSNFVQKFSQLKNKYTSYLQIINFLKKIDANNILSLSEANIDYVYELYLNSKEIVDFSINRFDSLMYGVDGLLSKTENYLRKIHFNIMCPIIKFYIQRYGVTAKDMKIIDSNSSELNAGKKINFYIEGVPTSVIYSDLIGKKFPIDYYKVSINYPCIEIINN